VKRLNVLVVGASGMLGSDLVSELQGRGHEVAGPSSRELDITDPTSVARLAAGEFGEFEWLINCAAYTAVDRAEAEVDQAIALNALAPGYLARACALSGKKLLHVSTDFVFDGEAGEPYTEEAPTNPLGVYGRTKRQGEEAVLATGPFLVCRTAWLYGPRGHCFPKTMIKAWIAEKPLRVVSDQFGNPTFTGDLARVLGDLVERDPFPGIYHTAGPEVLDWREFAVRTLEAYQEVTQQTLDRNPRELVSAIATADWPTPAKRPPFSALSFEKAAALGVAPMRPVHDALRDFVRRLEL
jgi:dTDP-4-dehydrorhamnose reductase